MNQKEKDAQAGDKAKDLSGLIYGKGSGMGGGSSIGSGGGLGGGSFGGAPPAFGGGGFGFGAAPPNKYQIPFDPHAHAAKTQAKSEYLFPENAKKERSYGERLCYGTGISYLVGQVIGGSWGMYEGLRASPAVAASSTRIRINVLLNALTKRGPFVANSFGVLALGYNGVHGAIHAATGQENSISQVASAVITGIAFKATSGPRSMALGGVVGGIVAATGVLAYNAVVGEN